MTAHSGGQTVTEHVGSAATRAANAGPGKCRPHYVADCSWACQSHTGRDHSQKDPPRCADATILEVERQCLSDIREQGKMVYEAALAADDDFSRPPADVADLQSAHLSRTQTQSREEQQDGVVAASAET